MSSFFKIEEVRPVNRAAKSVKEKKQTVSLNSKIDEVMIAYVSCCVPPLRVGLFAANLGQRQDLEIKK